MFERYTDRAHQAVVLAQEEARMLGHDYIGTEHILLGLIYEGRGIAATAMESLGVDIELARRRVEEIVGRGQAAAPGSMPFTPQAKKTLQLALREAMHLGHSYVGTEHILLGLVRLDEGPAAQLLASLGADPNIVRQQVIVLLHGHEGRPGPTPGIRSHDKAGRGKRKLLPQILTRLDAMEQRLAALEHRVGTGPDTSDLDQRIAQVRRDKESAIDTQDFETAAALRDTESQLVGERALLQRDWAALYLDLPSLSTEVERLRELLRQHGIEPRDGAA